MDAGGRYVAPGFVDPHTHSDISILQHPRAESVVRQGVTTHVTGNCGMSPAPLSAAHREDALHNWGSLLGHLRRGVGVEHASAST